MYSKPTTSITYFWVAMRGEEVPIIMAQIRWSDGPVEWVRPGSFALWIPDKDFMILEKVPDYVPFLNTSLDPGTRTTLGLFWE